MEVFIIAALLGLLPMFIAKNKGHDAFGWWLFGFLMFIVALPWSLCLADKTGRKCPACGERIKDEAVVCRFCGKDFRRRAQEG